MNFGEWVRKTRTARGLDIKALAALSGIDGSSISRIELKRTHATFLTAIRLCTSLDVTPGLLLWDLRDHATPVPHIPDFEERETATTATVRDVSAFVSLFRHDPAKGHKFLADWLGRLCELLRSAWGQEVLQEKLPDFCQADSARYVNNEPQVQRSMPYPEDIHPEQLLEIYNSGGVMLLKDAGTYLKRNRIGKDITLFRLELDIRKITDRSHISDSTLNRLEFGTSERVLFEDIFFLNQKLAYQDEIFGMYWRVTKLYLYAQSQQSKSDTPRPQPATWTEQDIRLVALFVTLYRWFQYVRPQDTQILNELRDQLRI